MIRVSTDPNDPHYDDRPRRVWCNDREITGWTVADEFRRCVITPDGVIYGAVLVERLLETVDEVAADDAEAVDVSDDEPECDHAPGPRLQRKPKRKPWR